LIYLYPNNLLIYNDKIYNYQSFHASFVCLVYKDENNEGLEYKK